MSSSICKYEIISQYFIEMKVTYFQKHNYQVFKLMDPCIIPCSFSCPMRWISCVLLNWKLNVNIEYLYMFHCQTGKVMKELDCSPYLVNLLHVTSVDEREDILYSGGSCKKLMLFEPQVGNMCLSTSIDWHLSFNRCSPFKAVIYTHTHTLLYNTNQTLYLL